VADGARFVAIVAAGQRPGVDPLAAHFGVAWKALVRVGGRTMLSHVVKTLLQSPAIARVIVIAQDQHALLSDDDTRWLAQAPRVSFAKSQASLSASLITLLEQETLPWPVLVTTADHPLLSRAMLEEVMAHSSESDVAVGLVERATLLARYPENKRTWLPFKGGAYSGANIFTFSGPGALKALGIWRDVEQDRKKGWKLLQRFGFWLAVKSLLRLITLEKAMNEASQKLGFSAKPVILPFAEAAIDVDKLSDHKLVETIMAEPKGA